MIQTCKKYAKNDQIMKKIWQRWFKWKITLAKMNLTHLKSAEMESANEVTFVMSPCQ